MARDQNFLLGRGERLASEVRVPKGGDRKRPPYTIGEAVERLSPSIRTVAARVAALPPEACYRDEAVAMVTMHPRYVAKSDFPQAFLSAVGLRAVGSRSRTIAPEQWGVARHQEMAVTEELFVAGARTSFARMAAVVQDWTDASSAARELQNIEAIGFADAREKFRGLEPDETGLVEFVLHNSSSDAIVGAFVAYATEHGGNPLLQYRRDVGGLTFLPVRVAAPGATEELARFTFVRVARAAPRMRPLRPIVGLRTTPRALELPAPAVGVELERAAVFDGGLPQGVRDALAPWVTLIEPEGIGPASDDFEDHGLAVTGALLFGPVDAHGTLPQPHCKVDHVRVMDYDAAQPGDEAAYLILKRVDDHLRAHPGRYKMVNLSVGLELPMEDDDVSEWTSTIDSILANGETIAAVASGNEGHRDRDAGLHRIQPPADGVNVLSVGAADRSDAWWSRAYYSSFGPGRSPGIVKPDGVAFGGDDAAPFPCVSREMDVAYMMGTSLAAPFALRSAAAVLDQLGNQLNPLATRALLIARADNMVGHDWHEVGWGRFESDSERTITCDDNEAVVVYQGLLPIGEHLRLPVPLPTAALVGRITLSATLLIATEVDAEHAATYTRSGLEVAFRPHSQRYSVSADGRQAAHPKTKPFFSGTRLYGRGEAALRSDGHKWEPCLRSQVTMSADSINEPCFDVYYHTRQDGRRAANPQPIAYAFVLAVRAPRMPGFYDDVVRSYAQILEPLRPQARIQLTGGTA